MAKKRSKAIIGLKPKIRMPCEQRTRGRLKPNPRVPAPYDHGTNRSTTCAVQTIVAVASICAELQRLQRNRVVNLKSRIMMENRLVSTVATFLGYNSTNDEADRKKQFDEAREVIERIVEGEPHPTLSGQVAAVRSGIDGFDDMVIVLEKQMVAMAKQLPVAGWVSLPAQRGFGLKSLAIIVGESGNLSNYANPGKLWRRLGCAPYTSQDKTLMGATWKGGKEGKLSAEEWEDYGYSPRRRSVMYVIGENLVKQNKSIYRERYDKTKQLAAEKHPDWKPLRCHRHAMLLATKLLLKNLWIEWNPVLATAGM